MWKSLLNRALQPIGYRVARSPHGAFRCNPRFEERDYQEVLAVIHRVVKSSGSDSTWRSARKYLGKRRASFYYDAADVLDAGGVNFSGLRVLDIGVFYGFMLRLLHGRHPSAHYFGTDTNETRIAIARQLCPTAKIWHGTIDSLEATEQYDLILLTEVLEHLAKPQAILHRLAGLTNRYLFLTVPDGRYDSTEAKEYRPEWDGYLGHVNFWSPESWTNWLAQELPNCKLVTGKLPTGQLYGLIERD